MRRLDLAGVVFGHLTAVRIAATRSVKVHWLCRCVCGSEAVVSALNLRSGHTRSCGCKGKGAASDRLMSFVEKRDDGCWQWTGAVAAGYGVFSFEGATTPAHRASLRLLKGVEVPAGHSMHVDHLCRNRLCVNPDHLELVTAAENIRRRDAAKELHPCG